MARATGQRPAGTQRCDSAAGTVGEGDQRRRSWGVLSQEPRLDGVRQRRLRETGKVRIRRRERNISFAFWFYFPLYGFIPLPRLFILNFSFVSCLVPNRVVKEDGDLFLGHLDLIFKWCTLRLSEKENSTALLKLLEVRIGRAQYFASSCNANKDLDFARMVHLVVCAQEDIFVFVILLTNIRICCRNW